MNRAFVMCQSHAKFGAIFSLCVLGCDVHPTRYRGEPLDGSFTKCRARRRICSRARIRSWLSQTRPNHVIAAVFDLVRCDHDVRVPVGSERLRYSCVLCP